MTGKISSSAFKTSVSASTVVASALEATSFASFASFANCAVAADFALSDASLSSLLSGFLIEDLGAGFG